MGYIMTSPWLSLWIASGIILQLAIYLLSAFGPASIKPRSERNVLTQAQASATTANVIVNFVESGKGLCWPPSARNLLEFAEANNISVHSGCRSGNCGSGQTRIISAEIEHCQSYNYQAEAGTCLLYVCTPKATIELEA
jgi:ferredoxin